jgi:A/G-specific adenine glycosylase
MIQPANFWFGGNLTLSLIAESFRNIVYDFYAKHGRKLPWRETNNPYHIFVSEFMLQQTQVERVLGKYSDFITEFPDFTTLAGASFQTVLSLWQGLGYNRRCLRLKKSAEIIVSRHQGRLPGSVDALVALPGIGLATASAMVTFSFNLPTVFIETNIRRVFIYHYFPDRQGVSDRDILPLIESTLDTENPRAWYYALMDYGVMLKKKYTNFNTKSRHYRPQPAFEGSNRQIRGMVLKTLVAEPGLSVSEILKRVSSEDDRVRRILKDLEKEGFLKRQGSTYAIND